MLGVLHPELSQLCPFVFCLCAPLADIRERLARFHSCFFVLRTKFGYKMQEKNEGRMHFDSAGSATEGPLDSRRSPPRSR